jgi:hypothetical protein
MPRQLAHQAFRDQCGHAFIGEKIDYYCTVSAGRIVMLGVAHFATLRAGTADRAAGLAEPASTSEHD